MDRQGETLLLLPLIQRKQVRHCRKRLATGAQDRERAGSIPDSTAGLFRSAETLHERVAAVPANPANPKPRLLSEFSPAA